jgi:hypothetical protein
VPETKISDPPVADTQLSVAKVIDSADDWFEETPEAKPEFVDASQSAISTNSEAIAPTNTPDETVQEKNDFAHNAPTEFVKVTQTETGEILVEDISVSTSNVTDSADDWFEESTTTEPKDAQT